MEQRDYLLRQIELMTQTLVNLIRRLFGLKEITEEEAEQATDEMLKESLDLSLTDILNQPLSKLVDVMLTHTGIHETNMDLLAEILVINAKATTEFTKKQQLLRRAQVIYEWLDQTSKTFSLDRHQKMREIQRMLEK
jgi:hypothetical protein